MIAEGESGVSFLGLSLAGGGVVIAAGMLVGLRWWRRDQRTATEPSLCPEEQRREPREEGLHIPILVRPADTRIRGREATLMDRSRGGLRFVGEHVYSVGKVLHVKGPRAGKWGWIPVRVTHCLRAGPRWEVGCQFVQKPSAKQLKYLS